MNRETLLTIDDSWVARVSKWLLDHDAPMGTSIIRMGIYDEDYGVPWGGILSEAINATREDK